MTTLNEDVIREILKYLWVLHTSSWDVEFRPDAFRRFFSRYALISRQWTLPAETYVYRSAHLQWDMQLQSFESGVKNPQRGQALRESIRTLDITISHSRLNIPLVRFDKILRYCPNLVELRLHIGAEVNTLFLKPSQESRLRQSIAAIQPTLRALQLTLDNRRTKSQVMKQLPDLIPFSNLDFLCLAWNGGDVRKPTLDPLEWDVRECASDRITVPIETNVQSLNLSSIIHADRDLSNPPLVVPETLRSYYNYYHPDHPNSLIKMVGRHLKQYLTQVRAYGWRWNSDLEGTLKVCPNIERLLLLETDVISTSKVYTPFARLNVLETQDWQTVDSPEEEKEEEEEEAEQNEGEGEGEPTEGDDVSAEREATTDTTTINEDTPSSSTSSPSPLTQPTPPPPTPRNLENGDNISTISHVVSFRHNKQEEAHNRPKYRNEAVIDTRWVSEALTGKEETREEKDYGGSYTWSWAGDLIPSYDNLLVALRQPSTLIPDEE